MRKRVFVLLLVEILVLSSLTFFVVAAGKKLNPWDQQKDGSCKMGSLCKGLITKKDAEKRTGCHAAGTEGGRTDFRDDAGNFCYAVQNPKQEKEKEVVVVNPTPTPTPQPTATPTPGPTSTPTPTPAPPQVIVIRQAPKKLPPTGFPTGEVAGGALISGSLGWFLLKRFKA